MLQSPSTTSGNRDFGVEELDEQLLTVAGEREKDKTAALPGSPIDQEYP